MSKLNETVYLIENRAVVARKLRDLMELVPATSRPDGLGTKDYARPNDDGAGVYRWMTWGGPERLLRQFDTVDEAVAHVEDLWIADIFGNTETAVYAARPEADEALRQELEESE